MDKNELEQIIDMYGNDILSFCHYLTRNREDAEDLFQGKRQIADAMQGHFQNGNLPKHWREEGYQRQMV